MVCVSSFCKIISAMPPGFFDSIYIMCQAKREIFIFWPNGIVTHLNIPDCFGFSLMILLFSRMIFNALMNMNHSKPAATAHQRSKLQVLRLKTIKVIFALRVI